MNARRILVLVALAVCIAPSAAHADYLDGSASLDWLSPPRRVARTWSASRDTPAPNLSALPRDVRTAGIELALVTYRAESWSLRTGFAGLLELESEGETQSASNLFPHGAGTILWRGSYAYYAAVSLDDTAERICAGCALELGLQYRHESQHYTGSNAGDAYTRDVRDQPYIGDDFIPEIAGAVESGDWLVAARAMAFVFLPGRSSYHGGPGLDLHLRWRGAEVHPFVSAYGERLWGSELVGYRFDDAYLVRALAGVALPSRLGDVMVFASADVGNRKGILGNTEEATLGLGIRLALSASAR